MKNTEKCKNREVEINRLLCERWWNDAFLITKQESSCGRSRFRSSTDAQKRTPTFSEGHWKGLWGTKKKYQSHTENIGGRNTFCIQNFKRNRKERSETFDRISHQVHALPWLATGKRPRSRKPSLLSCGQNKYLRGQVKGGAPDTWNQPLLYIYMLNLKIWLVMPHTKNIQAHFVSSYA